jgi:hypothetical protein
MGGERDLVEQLEVDAAGRVSASEVGAHFELGTAYAEMGLLGDAVEELEIVLRADPQHVRARAALVELRLRLAPPGSRPRDEPA